MSTNNIQRDRILFNRIAEGDNAAFRTLFDLYYESLRINAYRMLSSEFWAEEVAQEVLTKVWTGKEELTAIENPAGWLFRISANECLGQIRRRAREIQSQYLMQAALQGNDSVEIQPDHDVTLLRQLINKAVAQLPGQQKLTYKMKQEDELSYKEIANQLGISPNTVRNHLIQAYQFIRKYIQDYGDFFSLFVCMAVTFFSK